MELSDLVIKIRPSVVRVLVEFQGGGFSVGTGFFLRKNLVVTCAHVLLGSGPLKKLGEDLQSLDPTKTLEQLFGDHYRGKNPTIKLELSDGSFITATSANFDYLTDVAWINIPESEEYKLLEIGNDSDQDLGKHVAFCGFPDTAYVETKKWPFSVNAGFISTIANTYVTAFEKMNYIQINAVNLSGNSGGPLIAQGSGKLIGLINGNMNYGRDDMAFLSALPGMPPQIQATSFRIPIPVAYATPIRIVLSKLPSA